MKIRVYSRFPFCLFKNFAAWRLRAKKKRSRNALLGEKAKIHFCELTRKSASLSACEMPRGCPWEISGFYLRAAEEAANDKIFAAKEHRSRVEIFFNRREKRVAVRFGVDCC